MNAWSETLAVARLDFAEVRRSRWLWFCALSYGLLSGVFVWVGLRESTLLGFAGMGRVLLSVAHALLMILPLLALSATGQLVNRCREEGELELLFSLPLRRGAFLSGITLVRAGVLVLPLVLLMAGLGVVGSLAFGQQIPWALLGRALALCTGLLLCFVGVGIAVSTLVRSQARAALWVIGVWASSVVMLDFGLIGLMLAWRLNPATVFLLGALNPVQAARMGLLSAASPELSVLGPVGFFLANRLGAGALFLLGLGWPLLLGAACWLLALRLFCREDLV